MNQAKPKACNCDTEQILKRLNQKLVDWGEKHLNAIEYDLVDDVSMLDAHLMISYRRIFLGNVCGSCFDDCNRNNICSKILTHLYK
jgi:hypothetical protein